MIRRPTDITAFEFAVLSGLRAAQLNRGCTPRVARSAKIAITAQQEIAKTNHAAHEGRVVHRHARCEMNDDFVD